MEGNRQSTTQVCEIPLCMSLVVCGGGGSFMNLRLWHIVAFYLHCRNGVVRHESVMKLRNKLEELGKMKGVNQDEKGSGSFL